MVSRDIIEKIRESTDIVSLVEGYFPLKRTGSNYKALCPFHHEKTPSFVVSASKQIYHCFGCGESGNVFNFIMKMERLDFMEAVKRLSEQTGIKLDFEKDRDYQSRHDILNEIIELNTRSAKFYNKLLTDSNMGEGARKYLRKRKVSKEMIGDFQLGYAPAGNQLVKKAKKEGIPDDILVKSGLAGRNSSGRLYDMFRERIIYPIFDETGKIRGFGGRVLDDAQLPKYLNTAQTEVFEKKKLMYGFYQGKEKIKDAKKILLLEGYMDVIAAHQFGIKNAVATLGTSLTAEHVYKLRHWVDEVIFAFDADEAGSKATARGLDVILDSELMAKVCELSEGTDPEDIIRKNKEEFLRKVKKSVPILKWKIEYSRKKFEHIGDSADRKVMIVKELVPVISRISPIRRDEVCRAASERLNISEAAIKQEVNRILSNQPSYIKEKIKIETSSSVKEERLLKEILHVVVRYPQYIDEIKDILVEKNNRGKYYVLLDNYVKVFKGNIHKMIEEVDGKVRNIFAGLSLKPLSSMDNPGEHLLELKRDYKKFKMEKRFKEVASEINSLINENKPVGSDKKEEYDGLKKALKGTMNIKDKNAKIKTTI